MLRAFPPGPPLAALILLALAGRSSGQGMGPPVATVKLKSPAAHQVFQRDTNGLADIPADLGLKDAEVSGLTIQGVANARYEDGKFSGVPAGGPYTISGQVVTKDYGYLNIQSGPFYVGDLWVLAGQSNMEGVGDMADVAPPSPNVMALGMNGRWGDAREPLHRLVDSPDPVHSGDPATRAWRSAVIHKAAPIKGAGLGISFGAAMVAATGVPVGLVACAHGGTSMEQWSPSKRDEGGNSLYGSMLRQVRLAGGKVRGLLWYQGESDSLGGKAVSDAYPKAFADFIDAVRGDLGQPELPFYYVQIGRFVAAAPSASWNAVQDAQRRLPDLIPNTAVVASIDLELDDAIHVGTTGLKRLGGRLARVALREQFGLVGATTPTLDRVARGGNGTLVARFKGVNRTARNAQVGGLRPDRHVAGFSIRGGDGKEIPLIFEAKVGPARDGVVLKLTGPVPPGASLWYGHGLDPYCNLVDDLDMAVPVFGPIPLEADKAPVVQATEKKEADKPRISQAPEKKKEAEKPAPARATEKKPVELLIVTGDDVGVHDWKATTQVFRDFLSAQGRINVHVSSTPAKDLTDENLAKYDVLLLSYRPTKPTPETAWTEANKEAFLKAVRGGKGLVVYHFASSSFSKPNWEEFEKAVAGGWRTQGFHGPAHEFTVKKAGVDHPISRGLPESFPHPTDELYSNSMLSPGSVVLATAYCDPSKPRGTGKDEPVIWVNTYGKGRVVENVLGHDVNALSDPALQDWYRRGVLWAATGAVD